MAASVDGDIRLSVGLDTSSIESQLKSLGISMSNSVAKSMDASSNKIFDKLKAGVSKITRSFSITPEVDDSALKRTESSVERVTAKQKELGNVSQEAGDKMAKGVDKATRADSNLQIQIDRTIARIQELQKKQAALGATTVQSKEYTALEKEMNKLGSRTDEIVSRLNHLNSNEVLQVKYRGEIEALNKEFDETVTKIEKIEEAMGRLRSKGMGPTPGTQTEAYAKLGQEIEFQGRKLDLLYEKEAQAGQQAQKTGSQMRASHQSAGNSAKKAASSISSHFGNAFKKIRNLGGKMFNGIKGLFSRIKGKAKDTANDMDKSFKRGFRNILKYALGIRSFYLLFRKIRAAAKESLKAMATQFPEVNAQVSALKNSFIQLKGSVGTMVQPLLQALAPALTTIINLFSQALQVVGSFFALLTGQKFIYKAKKGTTSFANAQDESTKATKANTKALEENQKQLGHYDKLNIIDQDNKGGSGAGGGGGAGGGAGEMQFEKAPIPDWVNDFAKRIKEAWKKADFTEIGAIIGQKLRDALNKIPWKKIQTTAEKVGKSLGTLIAGFIKTPGLAKSIGNAIGQALNTVLLGIQNFIKNVPWYKFGEFIATGLSSALLAKDKNGTTLIGNIAKTFVSIVNAAIDTFLGFVKKLEWKKIGKEISKWLNWAIKNIKIEEFAEAIGRLINGLVDLMYEIFSNADTWVSLGTKIANGINKAFKTIDWAKMGKTISDGIKGILTTIETALSKLDWEAIGRAIGDFLGNIDWLGILGKAISVMAKAFWGLFKSIFLSPPKSVEEAIGKGILAIFTGIFVFKKFAPLVSTVKGLFGKILGKGVAQAAATGAVTAGAQVAGEGVAEAVGAGVASGKPGLIAKIGSTLKAAITAHPVIAAVAAAGAVVAGVAINAINKMIDEEIEAREYASKVAHEIGKREVENVTKTLDGLQKTLDGAKKVIKNFNKALKDIDSPSDKSGNIKNILKDYLELSKKTHLTAVETETLKKRTEQLIEKYPTLSKYVDKNTGLLKLNEKQLKSIIEQEKRQAKAIVAQQSAEALYNKKSELAEAIKKAKTAMDEAQSKFDAHYKKLQEIGQQQGKNSEAYQKQLKITGEVANALTNARLKYAALTEQEKKNNEAIKTANNLMELAKVKASTLAKTNDKLKESLKQMGIKASDQKKIMSELKTALEKGEISWKQYKSIVDKNYKSVGALKAALDKTGKTKVSPTLNVKVTGKEEMNRVQKYFATFKNGKKTYTQILKIQAQFSDPAVKKAFASGYFSPSDYVMTVRKKASGGIYTGSGWHNVEGYASGGTPKSGQFFMARENGIPELVGTIRNHTAVMNNNQIVASVANGVYRAVAGVASAILPYVRSQTHAMNWLAQNGLQLPDIPKITLGNIIPSTSEFLNASTGTTTNNINNGIDYDMLVQAFREAQSKEPIVVQMPNGKVLAEAVWDEEEKRYKQTRSSTLRPKFA